MIKRFNRVFSTVCRLALNHTKSLSPAASVLTAQHEKMLHAVNSSMDEDANENDQM
jgi:hypothetical protein